MNIHINYAKSSNESFLSKSSQATSKHVTDSESDSDSDSDSSQVKSSRLWLCENMNKH